MASVEVIVSGKTPEVAPVAWRLDLATRGPRRIILEVDPRTPRAVVGQTYAEVRQMLARDFDVQTESRPLAAKHARLADFLDQLVGEERTRDAYDDDSGREPDMWRRAMKRWNARWRRKRPAWCYGGLREFKRDAQAAFRRVTDEPWPKNWGWSPERFAHRIFGPDPGAW
jgi:hypothetical protein